MSWLHQAITIVWWKRTKYSTLVQLCDGNVHKVLSGPGICHGRYVAAVAPSLAAFQNKENVGDCCNDAEGILNCVHDDIKEIEGDPTNPYRACLDVYVTSDDGPCVSHLTDYGELSQPCSLRLVSTRQVCIMLLLFCQLR